MGTDDNNFVVYKKDVNQRKFIQWVQGLYYCDVSVNNKKNDFTLVNAVKDNEKITKYFCEEILQGPQFRADHRQCKHQDTTTNCR